LARSKKTAGAVDRVLQALGQSKEEFSGARIPPLISRTRFLEINSRSGWRARAREGEGAAPTLEFVQAIPGKKSRVLFRARNDAVMDPFYYMLAVVSWLTRYFSLESRDC